MIDPFARVWPRDKGGNPLTDKDGNFLIPLAPGETRPVVTNVTGGATKMFLIHDDPPMVAVTSGLAKLNDRTMSALGREFAATKARQKRPLVNSEAIAKAFLGFLRREYENHYKGSERPKEFQEGPEFLLGGYSRDDAFPSLYRVQVAKNRIITDFPAGKFGMSWNGQSDSVERIVRGYDSGLRAEVERHVAQAFERHHRHMAEAALQIVQRVLARLGTELPDDLDTSLPSKVKAEIPWDQMRLIIDFSNMPVQNGIDFVSWLVMVQSGRSKFAVGLPTVGGRTHIGIATKSDGFRMLDEPELEHIYTGFAHDL